jgi:hypothetical protein
MGHQHGFSMVNMVKNLVKSEPEALQLFLAPFFQIQAAAGPGGCLDLDHLPGRKSFFLRKSRQLEETTELCRNQYYMEKPTINQLYGVSICIYI